MKLKTTKLYQIQLMQKLELIFCIYVQAHRHTQTHTDTHRHTQTHTHTHTPTGILLNHKMNEIIWIDLEGIMLSEKVKQRKRNTVCYHYMQNLKNNNNNKLMNEYNKTETGSHVQRTKLMVTCGRTQGRNAKYGWRIRSQKLEWVALPSSRGSS